MKKSKEKRQVIRDKARMDYLASIAIADMTDAQALELRIVTRRMVRHVEERPANYYAQIRRKMYAMIRRGKELTGSPIWR